MPGHVPREFTDLSSIDLNTEEDEERPCSSRYRFTAEERGDEDDHQQWGQLLARGALALVTAAAVCTSLVAVTKVHSWDLPDAPALSSAVPLPPLPFFQGQGEGLNARQLLEGPELTQLASTRMQAADPQLAEATGPTNFRDMVASGFRHVAATAPNKLSSLQLTLEQKEAVLQVLRDMSDNPRLHSNGLFLARTIQEGLSHSEGHEGMARFFLERLRERLPVLRQLREEVIPAALRIHAEGGPLGVQDGELTLDSEKLHFVETFGDRWNLEVDASLPQVSEERVHMPRRLKLGIDQHTSSFVEEMHMHAHLATTALATSDADLSAAIQGLDAAAAGTSTDPADQKQIAKSMACDALTEATNGLTTVNQSLADMMARLQRARRTLANQTARRTVAKRIFRDLQAKVQNVIANITSDKAEFQARLSQLRALVSSTENSSVVITRSFLLIVQTEVQEVQAKLKVAFKEFKALYLVNKGSGNLIDIVRLYADSIYYQLQEWFRVPLPAMGNASLVLRYCLQEPSGMLHALECKLTYAKVCIEMMFGMKVEFRIESTTTSALSAMPQLPSVIAATATTT